MRNVLSGFVEVQTHALIYAIDNLRRRRSLWLEREQDKYVDTHTRPPTYTKIFWRFFFLSKKEVTPKDALSAYCTSEDPWEYTPKEWREMVGKRDLEVADKLLRMAETSDHEKLFVSAHMWDFITTGFSKDVSPSL